MLSSVDDQRMEQAD